MEMTMIIETKNGKIALTEKTNRIKEVCKHHIKMCREGKLDVKEIITRSEWAAYIWTPNIGWRTNRDPEKSCEVFRLAAELINFDWTFEMSDCPNTYNRGYEKQKELLMAIKAMDALDRDRIMVLAKLEGEFQGWAIRAIMEKDR